MVSGVFSNRDLETAREQRRAAARAALDEMEGRHGSVAWTDDRLDFLAEEVSEHSNALDDFAPKNSLGFSGTIVCTINRRLQSASAP